MLDRVTTKAEKTNHKFQDRQRSKLTNCCLPYLIGNSTQQFSSSIHTDAILSETTGSLVARSQTTRSSDLNKTIVQNRHPTISIYQRRSRHKSSDNLTTLQKQLVSPEINTSPRDCSYRTYNSHTRGENRGFKMMGHIYYLFASLSVLCVITLSLPKQVVADGSLQSNLQKLKIHPDIIQASSYTGTIKVELHGNVVKPGDQVPARNFKGANLNKVSWDSSGSDYHTLLLLDLDRKTGPNNTQSIYNQYTCINIPGSEIGQGQCVVAFETPNVPCQTSSKHRLLMLVYNQAQGIDIADVAYMSALSGQSKNRANFKLDDFTSRHRLDLKAANVFFAIGEVNGNCSGGLSLHSIQSVSSILIAMVMAVTAFISFSDRIPAII